MIGIQNRGHLLVAGRRRVCRAARKGHRGSRKRKREESKVKKEEERVDRHRTWGGWAESRDRSDEEGGTRCGEVEKKKREEDDDNDYESGER